MTNEVTAIGFKVGEASIGGTCLQGYINTDYATLRACFGPTTDQHDDYKSDASWTITFADGVVATVYNWKDGHAYCGYDGLDVEDITEWHIGGHNGTDAEGRVKEVLNAYLEKVCYNPLADDIKKLCANL